MLKKILSGVIAATMVISSMAMVVSAADYQTTTATITVYDSDNNEVGSGYTSLTSAINAAGNGGTVQLSEGYWAVNSTEGVNTAGVTIKGAGMDSTFIVPSTTFTNAEEENRRSLLTIAQNVTIKDIAFDGSAYGEDITSSTNFTVLRANRGDDIKLENVYITGSPKTLLLVGMSSASATVVATNLYCEADRDKVITDTEAYADIDITKGSFTLTGNSVVNGTIFSDDNATFYNNCTSNHFLLKHKVGQILFIPLYEEVTSTVEYYVDTFVESNASDSIKEMYVDSLTLSDNTEVVGDMVNYAIANIENDRQTVERLLTVLNYAVEQTGNSTITTHRNTVQEALNGGI